MKEIKRLNKEIEKTLYGKGWESTDTIPAIFFIDSFIEQGFIIEEDAEIKRNSFYEAFSDPDAAKDALTEELAEPVIFLSNAKIEYNKKTKEYFVSSLIDGEDLCFPIDATKIKISDETKKMEKMLENINDLNSDINTEKGTIRNFIVISEGVLNDWRENFIGSKGFTAFKLEKPFGGLTREPLKNLMNRKDFTKIGEYFGQPVFLHTNVRV